MSKQVKKLLFLFVVLFIPSIFGVVLYKSKFNMKSLPHIGPATVDGAGDSVFYKIPDFSFTDHRGNTVTKANTEGKITIVDFFFATCQGICPKMTTNLTRVQTDNRDKTDWIIISHTVNPEHDSVPVLKAYADKYHAGPNWHIVTGEKVALYEMARKGYFLPVDDGDGSAEDFIHSEKLVLIDKQGHIRGFFDGTDPNEVRRLNDEMDVLRAREYSLKTMGKKKK